MQLIVLHITLKECYYGCWSKCNTEGTDWDDVKDLEEPWKD